MFVESHSSVKKQSTSTWRRQSHAKFMSKAKSLREQFAAAGRNKPTVFVTLSAGRNNEPRVLDRLEHLTQELYRSARDIEVYMTDTAANMYSRPSLTLRLTNKKQYDLEVSHTFGNYDDVTL